MPRFIAIPLYDHTTDEEVEEILADLDRLQFSLLPVVVHDDLHAMLASSAIAQERDELHSVHHELHTAREREQDRRAS